ncbi:MAG: hypothetical protein RLZZ165_1308 [Bacteroidota bacterium]
MQVAFSQLHPAIGCWHINTTGTGFAGALTNVQEVNYSATYVYVKTEDIPSWIPIQYDWPNNPWFAVPMNYQFRFRLNPIPNVGPATAPGYGHIGLWVNGCSIYNPKDAKSYQDSSVWFQNAWYWEHLLGETFDSCIGHPNASGEYHTHVSPACLYDFEDSTVASPLIGYAFDYYPIYGGYGHADPLDTNSAVIRLRSSYRLREITGRTTLPDGTVLSPEHYGPALDSVPLGGYVEDYEYVAGWGDLDAHNGRFSITRDYPNGIYTYHTTIDWVADTFGYHIKPVYPYVIGHTFYGEVYPGDGNTGPGSGFVVINEAVTPYSPSTSIGEEPARMNVSIYPNPMSSQLNILVGNPDPHEAMACTILNSNGAIVEEFPLNANSVNVFDGRSLASGVYLLKVKAPSALRTFKVVVAK